MRRWLIVVPCTAALLVPGWAAGAAPIPNARAWILVDPATGEVLAKRGADVRLPMASTTKLMTAIVTLERAKLTDVVVVPRAALAPGGSTSGLVAGERISVRNLITGLMVGSGNDASVALAAHVGKGAPARFVRFMNAEAQTLGLERTRFRNPHGLDQPGHYSTVRELVKLGQQAMTYPIVRQTVRNTVATIPGPGGRGTRRLESENDLLTIDRDADGVKTGHTAKAGYALVAHARRRSSGVELYMAMIGSPSRAARARDAKRLLDWGFAQYARLTPLAEGQIVTRVPVRDRPGVTAGLTVDTPLTVTIRKGRTLSRTIVAPVEIVGPQSAGTVVGQVTLRSGDDVLGTRKLVLAADIDGPSVSERIRSGIGRLV